MTNNQIMYFLLKNDNLKDLSFKNGSLTYQGKSINITNVVLYDFLNQGYGQLFQDKDIITSEDFFNIMDIHSKKIETLQNEKEKEKIDEKNKYLPDNNKIIYKKEYDVISIKHYFSLLEKNNDFTEEEKQDVQDFETYISELYKYKQYLLSVQKSFLTFYETYITNLSELPYLNEYIQLNKKQQTAIDKYNNIVQTSLNEQNKQANKVLSKDVSSGFSNSIIIILVLIITGVLIGSCAFFLLK